MMNLIISLVIDGFDPWNYIYIGLMHALFLGCFVHPGSCLLPFVYGLLMTAFVGGLLFFAFWLLCGSCFNQTTEGFHVIQGVFVLLFALCLGCQAYCGYYYYCLNRKHRVAVDVENRV